MTARSVASDTVMEMIPGDDKMADSIEATQDPQLE